MFDIGFSELMVIGAVALVVIGPEELPRVARTAGHLLGRVRRYVTDVKSDISREMELSEFKRMQDELAASARDIKDSLTQHTDEIRENVERQTQEINALGAELERTIAPPSATPAAPVAADVAPQIEASAGLPATPRYRAVPRKKQPVASVPSDVAEGPATADLPQIDMFGGNPPQDRS